MAWRLNTITAGSKVKPKASFRQRAQAGSAPVLFN